MRPIFSTALTQKKPHKNLQFFLSFSFTLTHYSKNLIFVQKKKSIFGPKLQDMTLRAKNLDFSKIEFFGQKLTLFG